MAATAWCAAAGHLYSTYRYVLSVLNVVIIVVFVVVLASLAVENVSCCECGPMIIFIPRLCRSLILIAFDLRVFG
jgi:hypothetical protein